MSGYRHKVAIGKTSPQPCGVHSPTLPPIVCSLSTTWIHREFWPEACSRRKQLEGTKPCEVSTSKPSKIFASDAPAATRR